jgi:hypothetical protein
VTLAALVAAFAFPGPGRAGDQATLSWTIDDEAGKPVVTWTITGSTKWYVGVVQIADRPDVDGKGDFPPKSLVGYDVLPPGKATGSWRSPHALDPGTYYGRLTLRYDGACEANCESRSSVRSFSVDPSPLSGLHWKATSASGKVRVSWTGPDGGWYVGVVLVDDDADFSSPEEAGSWPAEREKSSWTSRRLEAGTYFVRLHARFEGCATCLFLSKVRKVTVNAVNPAPRLGRATFTIVRRDEATLHHVWRTRFRVCDRTPGRLTLQIREETWSGTGGAVKARTTKTRLAAPKGCRSYGVERRSAWPFRGAGR